MVGIGVCRVPSRLRRHDLQGQGKTLDETYLLHTHHWRQASSYVALTRQREKAQVFVATETARDVRELARQMRRSEVKAASAPTPPSTSSPAQAAGTGRRARETLRTQNPAPAAA